MQIFIVGIRHQIQSAEIQCWSCGRHQAFEQEQKDRFASLLRENIAEHGVQIVVEEASHEGDTITKIVCERLKCQYVNIDMPLDERNVQGIPAGYNENPDTAPGDCKRWNREREEYMAARAIAEAGSVASMMVICGRGHMQALAERFECVGHKVEMCDLRDQPWYIDNWTEHMWR